VRREHIEQQHAAGRHRMRGNVAALEQQDSPDLSVRQLSDDGRARGCQTSGTGRSDQQTAEQRCVAELRFTGSGKIDEKVGEAVAGQDANVGAVGRSR
jgi:hypothetical protein